MKVMRANGLWTIHGDDLEVMDELPGGTYRVVRTSAGPALARVGDLTTGGAPIYGGIDRRADAILDGFLDGDRQMGVIMEGGIGLGKTLMARYMGERLLEMDIPVIVVGNTFEGLFEWLPSIDQRCMVLFDELDKMDGVDACGVESSALSYFDGVSAAPHLNVVTANELEGEVARYITNRPGRFRWNIRFDSPSTDAIVEFLRDRDVPVSEAEAIMRINVAVPLNYDMLDAIASEVSRGRRVVDFIDDMNILNDGSRHWIAVSWSLRLPDGRVVDGVANAMTTGHGYSTNVLLVNSSNEYGVGSVWVSIQPDMPEDGTAIDPAAAGVRHQSDESAPRASDVELVSLSVVRGRDMMALSGIARGGAR